MLYCKSLLPNAVNLIAYPQIFPLRLNDLNLLVIQRLFKRQRGGKASKRGLSDEHPPVLICRDRAENMADYVLDKSDKAHIEVALKPLLAKDAMLCTDGGKAFACGEKFRHLAPSGQSIGGHTGNRRRISCAERESV